MHRVRLDLCQLDHSLNEAVEPVGFFIDYLQHLDLALLIEQAFPL